jgi:hypothetical protein
MRDTSPFVLRERGKNKPPQPKPKVSPLVRMVAEQPIFHPEGSSLVEDLHAVLGGGFPNNPTEYEDLEVAGPHCEIFPVK